MSREAELAMLNFLRNTLIKKVKQLDAEELKFLLCAHTGDVQGTSVYDINNSPRYTVLICSDDL